MQLYVLMINVQTTLNNATAMLVKENTLRKYTNWLGMQLQLLMIQTTCNQNTLLNKTIKRGWVRNGQRHVSNSQAFDSNTVHPSLYTNPPAPNDYTKEVVLLHYVNA